MEKDAYARSSRLNKPKDTSSAPALNAKIPEPSSGARLTEKGSGGAVGSTGVSHATGESGLPQKLQEIVPENVEHAVPNALHDTGEQPDTAEQLEVQGSRWVSHAKPGGSILPEVVQKLVPESVERMVPNVIHDTGDKGVFEK
jgi:hypothetical protein